MAQYIPKEPLLAEIEKRLDELYGLLPDASKVENGMITILEACNTGKYTALESILSLVKEELEVKEVDLDKEIEEHVIGMPMSEFTNDGEVEDYLDWARKEFRHFFELGLKAQKGE